jgi:plasmid segregation protein ParM
MSKLLTIDIGNSVFKVGYENTNKEFNSKIKKIDINTMDLAEAIVYEGECFAISQGDYVHNNFKADKEGLEQFILYAISTMIEARERETTDVSLLLNLPVNQLSNKELLKTRLQKTYQFTVNSPLNGINKKSRNIRVTKIGVVAESVASYYSLEDELTDFIIMFDIGSKTINYATYTEIGVNDIAKTDTLDFGIHDLYKDVIDYYKSEYHRTYTISDIDARVKANKINIPSELKIEFINKIKNNLNAKGFTDYDDYSIKCCGGGSLVLGKELKTCFRDIQILENALFRNNMGSKLIAESIGF